MKNNQPFVSVIIANYNGEQYLPTCLTSVIKTKYKNFEVLLVDDGSVDASIALINKFLKKDNRISLLKNEKNIGAAASRNRAAKVAKGDLLIFLDNDTEVDESWLTEIVKTLSSDNPIGACQAKLRDFEKRDTIQIAGVKLWAATGWGLPIGQGEKDKGQFDREENIIALSAAMGVKKDVFERVSGFDELEGVVTEDLDLCWRIWLSGYRIVLCPTSVVYHWTKSVSMRKNMKHTNEKIYFHLTKNSLISIIKNYQSGNVWKYCFSSICISLGRSLLVFLRRGDGSSFLGSLKGVIWTILHLFPILIKRKEVQQVRKYSDDYLFSTILVKGSIVLVYKKYFVNTNLL